MDANQSLEPRNAMQAGHGSRHVPRASRDGNRSGRCSADDPDNLLVGDYRRARAARPDASLAEAARILIEHRISGLPVVNASGKLVGIVTEHDFLRKENGSRPRWLDVLLTEDAGQIAARELHDRRVEDVMSRNPVSVGVETPVKERLELMQRHRVKRIPAIRYRALGKVGTQRPFSSRVFQPTWSTCRCVHKTTSMSSGATPADRKVSSHGQLRRWEWGRLRPLSFPPQGSTRMVNPSWRIRKILMPMIRVPLIAS